MMHALDFCYPLFQFQMLIKPGHHVFMGFFSTFHFYLVFIFVPCGPSVLSPMKDLDITINLPKTNRGTHCKPKDKVHSLNLLEINHILRIVKVMHFKLNSDCITVCMASLSFMCSECLTSGLLDKTGSNCLSSSGGDMLSISAPRTAMATLTSENLVKYQHL